LHALPLLAAHSLPHLGIQQVLLREDQLEQSLTAFFGLHFQVHEVSDEEALVAACLDREACFVFCRAIVVRFVWLLVRCRVKYFEVPLRLLFRLLRHTRLRSSVLLATLALVDDVEFEWLEHLARLDLEELESALHDVKTGRHAAKPLDLLVLEPARDNHAKLELQRLEGLVIVIDDWICVELLQLLVRN